MILYHICPKSRLEEKLSYAKENGGNLLLTPPDPKRDLTGGHFPIYLHCLPLSLFQAENRVFLFVYQSCAV